MEIILTQHKDFSSKSVTFNNCVQAEVYSFCYEKEEDKPRRPSSDIECGLVSLKKELVRTLEILLNLCKEKYGRQHKHIMGSRKPAWSIINKFRRTERLYIFTHTSFPNEGAFVCFLKQKVPTINAMYAYLPKI